MRTPRLISSSLLFGLLMPVYATAFSPSSHVPQVLNSHTPHYPQAAVDLGIEGVVLLQVEVNAAGKPSKVLVKNDDAHPLLQRAAINSVRQWQFEPAMRQGLPSPATLKIPIRFELAAMRDAGRSVSNSLPFGR